MQEGPRNRHALDHSPAQESHRISGAGRQPNRGQGFSGPLAPLIEFIQPRSELEVLARGQVVVEQALMREKTDIGPTRGIGSQVRAEDTDRPSRGTHEPGQDPEQSRLSGTVRSGDNEEFTGANREVQSTEYPRSPESTFDPQSRDRQGAPRRVRERCRGVGDDGVAGRVGHAANIPSSPADGFEFEQVEELCQGEEVADFIARVPQNDPLMTFLGAPLDQHERTQSGRIHAAG